MVLKELILQRLIEKLPHIKIIDSEFKGELTLYFDKRYVADICKLLKEDPDLNFNLCEDITAIDWAKRKNRYTVIYHIFSLKNKFRLVLRTDIDESDLSVNTVSSVWKTANWHERETYDMYGIKFNNHPDLRRMYLPEDFEYHPLRKDFPLMGIPGSFSLPKK